MQKITYLLLISMAFSVMPAQSNPIDNKITLKNRITTALATAAFIAVYNHASVIAHELGHAVPASLISGKSVPVKVNSNSASKPVLDTRLVQMHTPTTIKKLLFPSAYIPDVLVGMTKNQKIAVHAGGPLAAIMFSCCAAYAGYQGFCGNTFVSSCAKTVDSYLLVAGLCGLMGNVASLYPYASDRYITDSKKIADLYQEQHVN